MKRMILAAVCLLVLGLSGFAWVSHTDRPALPSFTVVKASFARRVTADGNLVAVTATPVKVPQLEGWGTMTIAWLASDGSQVKTGDVIARFDSSDAEKQLRDAQVELDVATARLRQQVLSAAESDDDHDAEARNLAQQAELRRRFRETDPLLYTRMQIQIGELEDKAAAAHLEQAERVRDVGRGLSRADVELAKLDRKRVEISVERAKKALANLELHAPADGILVFVRDGSGDLPKLGSQVYADQEIAQIPELTAMEAELFVLEVDGNGLDEGQPADVVVESHPERAYHGSIRLVDKVAKPRETLVPVQYFSVTIALDQTDRAVMKPGQRVRATLELGKQDTIAVPRQAVFEKDGKTIVYRRGEHGYTPVAVELGAATPGRIAITSGLVEGDVIALRDPQGAP